MFQSSNCFSPISITDGEACFAIVQISKIIVVLRMEMNNPGVIVSTLQILKVS